MNFDFEKVWQSKREYRKQLAALPIGEKLRMLDAMRARTLAIRSAKRIDAPASNRSPAPAPDKAS